MALRGRSSGATAGSPPQGLFPVAEGLEAQTEMAELEITFALEGDGHPLTLEGLTRLAKHVFELGRGGAAMRCRPAGLAGARAASRPMAGAR
jgi:hypothetical protein